LCAVKVSSANMKMRCIICHIDIHDNLHFRKKNKLTKKFG
jgi:hypothetical protein